MGSRGQIFFAVPPLHRMFLAKHPSASRSLLIPDNGRIPPAPTPFFSAEAPGCIHLPLPARLAPTGYSLYGGRKLLLPFIAFTDLFYLYFKLLSSPSLKYDGIALCKVPVVKVIEGKTLIVPGFMKHNRPLFIPFHIANDRSNIRQIIFIILIKPTF